jgi:methionyl-tRNA synthetase
MSGPIFITTTIPYVNAAPHIGFALELVQADVIARHRRLCGDDVCFQTGTDENAFKNVSSARERGVPVRALVDENAARFRALADLLDISIDQFVRTTTDTHHAAVTTLLARLRPEDVYRRAYYGLYCELCEDFFSRGDLVEGRCPDHGTPPIALAEENVFFRLSRYQEAIRELIATNRLVVVPEARRLEVLRFVERGLVDISISRDARRCEGWGVPFPGDPSQVVYVWIDALINYLTKAGHQYWDAANTIHFIGKNVWKFHAVYWPALLLSAGLSLPEQIVVHGFLTNDGRKISKSTGDAVDPTEYVRRVGVDGVRYFLLRHVRPFEDTDFSTERLDAAYQADLVHGIGNLVSRVTALCEAANVGGSSASTLLPAHGGYRQHLTTFRFDLALAEIWSEITALNQEISATKPWDDVRTGCLTTARAKLLPVVERLGSISHWLAPFLPSTSAAIRVQLSQAPIRKSGPLFPRLR